MSNRYNNACNYGSFHPPLGSSQLWTAKGIWGGNPERRTLYRLSTGFVLISSGYRMRTDRYGHGKGWNGVRLSSGEAVTLIQSLCGSEEHDFPVMGIYMGEKG